MYPNLDIVALTLFEVDSLIFALFRITLDTVDVATFASLATSLIVTVAYHLNLKTLVNAFN